MGDSKSPDHSFPAVSVDWCFLVPRVGLRHCVPLLCYTPREEILFFQFVFEEVEVPRLVQCHTRPISTLIDGLPA